ncbi:MAG TPA: prolyl oligopeptidase family serine peptidase [Cyclobacteriaceae bacterium]|nr:prolyl oligopeptidase family serine peptidase [Cyclobacteriaceae bacterium]HRK53088.1 prolyl oligopeptidase family serine peptidase [Cyclobacteriaceae bacterium]
MKYFFLLTSLVLSTISYAQKASNAPKKALDHTVYDNWKEITYEELTPDGKHAAFTINPQDGDGKIIFYNLKTSTQDSVYRAANISLTYDSKYAVFKIKPQQNLVKELRRQKKKKDELPKDSLGIYSFLTRKTEKVPNIKSYKVPEKAGDWVAYQLEAKKEEKTKADGQLESDKAKKLRKNNDDNGYTLVLRKLSDGKETSFDFVTEYQFAKFGQGLLFSTTGNLPSLEAGVYWYDLQNEKLNPLYKGHPKFKYKGLSISESGDQSAFLVDSDTTKALVRHFKLYHWKKGDALAQSFDLATGTHFPKDWILSQHYTPLFSKKGDKLFVGTAPIPVVQDTTLLPEEIVSVEVWHSEDAYIYPMQNVSLDDDRKKSYLAAISLSDKKMTQLGDEAVPQVQTGDEGNSNILFGKTNVPYLKAITWEGNVPQDLYLFDLQSASKKKIANEIRGYTNLSPKANYVYWYSEPDTAWFAYSIKTEKTVNLTAGLNVTFADELDDHPDYPGRYGEAGWTTDDDMFIAYDRYDMWAFDPQGNKPPINLTKIGRQQKIVFRYVKLDKEERNIDTSKELLLSAFDETTKASGFYTLSLKNEKLTKRIMDDFRFGNVKKAQLADQLLFTRESFREFPDVWTAPDTKFSNIKKLSEANPQAKNYFWGNVSLVKWNSLDNVPLEGLLYKPEGFDPNKKYPMIVYFYERNSGNLHDYTPPTPLRSTINRTTYVSDGYLVFVPDIVYKIGFPGESAYNSIMPGVTSLIDKGFVDRKNIGIQGHSWGGYQAAYLVTRTNLFKAAEAGAIVANMTSAYGGIRWGSGMSRMFQYEHTQSRIGGTLWEKPLLYLENSPLFFADKIETPMLLLHNDADSAVPWYQGIEMYMAMRRLNKPVWMLNYNGEPHWPVKRENRMDFQIRMKQFFDFYLKSAEEPLWMKEGIPAIEKGIKTGY